MGLVHVDDHCGGATGLKLEAARHGPGGDTLIRSDQAAYCERCCDVLTRTHKIS
jgi:hypothetical protein